MHSPSGLTFEEWIALARAIMIAGALAFVIVYFLRDLKR